MERDVSMEEISDGRLYGLNDLVKADCRDCRGCSRCCRDMGSSILLDPLDVFRLSEGLGASFEELLERCLELHAVDGVILPNLKMDEKRNCCVFLNDQGRCSIHSFRPGICRIFPLGRFYENRDFRYFLQIRECPASRSKIKVKKWIDTPDLPKNQEFIRDWHFFLKDLKETFETEAGAARQRAVNVYVLKEFYQTPFDPGQDFYRQFQERLERAGKACGLVF